MRRLFQSGLIFSAAILFAIFCGPGTSTTNASNSRYHSVKYTYKKVVTYEWQREAYSVWVTKYDKYGCKYRVKVIRYHKVRVPVLKWVKVCH